MNEIERYNEAIDRIQKLEDQATQYQNKSMESQLTLLELVQLNFELKEELIALRNENEELIAELESKTKEIDHLLPLANKGEKAMNLFEEFTNELNKKNNKK